MISAPIQVVGVFGANGAVDPSLSIQSLPASMATPRAGGFADMLMSGIGQINQKLIDANALATSFALDDSVPIHQVTYALEQARMSVELMMQVRSRLLEGYQDIMRTQL